MIWAAVQRIAPINRGTLSRTGAAIAERALLGVATFLATVLVGRWGGKAEFGLFALFLPMVFVPIAIEESLITAPYTVNAGGRSRDGRRRYLGSVLWHTAILALITSSAFAVAAIGLLMAGRTQSSVVAAVLAVAMPWVLLREFARRVVYADLNPRGVLLLSGAASALQLAMMAAFHTVGRLDAAGAYAAMGASSAIAGGIWLALNRGQIEFRPKALKATFHENWLLGRWIAPTQVGEIIRTQMFPWLLAIVSDRATVGAYAACAVVASLPTPLQNALSNMLLPEFAQLERRDGASAANRLMWQATAWLAAVMTAFLVVAIALSDMLVPLFYGAAYAGTAHPLIVLVIAQWFAGVSLPSARALLVLKRPDQVFWAHLTGIAVNLVIGWPLVAWRGVVGAAYAVLVGAVLKAVLGGWWYIAEARRQLLAEGAYPTHAGDQRLTTKRDDVSLPGHLPNHRRVSCIAAARGNHTGASP